MAVQGGEGGDIYAVTTGYRRALVANLLSRMHNQIGIALGTYVRIGR